MVLAQLFNIAVYAIHVELHISNVDGQLPATGDQGRVGFGITPCLKGRAGRKRLWRRADEGARGGPTRFDHPVGLELVAALKTPDRSIEGVRNPPRRRPARSRFIETE
jgi:hypothetical protein